MIDSQISVVTGVGAYSAGGENIFSLWRNLLEGRARIAFHQLKNKNLQVPVYAANSPHFSGNKHRLLRHADRSVCLALAAAEEAWQSSGLSGSFYQPARVGVIIGTSRGPATIHEQNILKAATYPSAPLYGTFSSVAGVVGEVLRTEGDALVVSSTCTSGAMALHLAEQMIRLGELDVAVVGGVEAPLVDFIFEQYLAAGVLSQNNRLAPFDSERTGTILGEGAAFVILESKKFATQRNASILAELQAVTLRSYPEQRGSLDKQGLSLQTIITASLQKANILPHEIDLIHLHGTGTHLNDLIESRAVEAIFGKLDQQPISWASKAITGHTLGASSLFQVVLTLQAVLHSLIPETVNCTHLDSACSLRIHHGPPVIKPVKHALCLTSGFWGNAAGIVLKNWDENRKI